MSNYNNLKTAIQQVIKQNGKQEITGDILQSTLLAMVNSIGENYQYKGIATPQLDPGSPDQNVMYITSQNGVYTNFNNLQVENEIAVLTFNGEWAKQTIYNLETVNDLKSRASQTYDNLAAIQASGESNPNKIYIDGETLIPYVYKGGSFVPFSDQDDGTIPIQRCIDLSEFGPSVTGVYRFDDTGYYIITPNNFTKTDLHFKKIYTVNISNTSNRLESGHLRNVLCKIGNKIFLAACNSINLVYMYDEETSEGKYLGNPESLQYYGTVYAYDGKVYYFHRHDKPHIYVYDADGNLITNKAYDHGYIKITDGIAFTEDGYKVNLEDLTF